VGKSTLVRLFARERKLRLFEVNLERHLYLGPIFKSGSTSRVMTELEGIFGEIGNGKESLVFLDEIQAVPEAISFLRYFFEERPDLAVIAAGSLLEFALADHSFPMPVGRIVYYHLGPMSFGEFLLALDPDLYHSWRNCSLREIIPQNIHTRLIEKQREYLFYGGMPEAVRLKCEGASLEEISEVHRSIIDTYTDDFATYARKSELIQLQSIFRSIPAMVGKKVKYSKLFREDRSAEVKAALELLIKARVCTRVVHSDCNGIPLEAERNDRVFKLLFLDCGLMNHLLGLTWRHIHRLEEHELINEGPLAEQFVGQELITSAKGRRHPILYYWLREGKSGNAEVDYVWDHEGKIYPLEVKAGRSGSLKSLHQFMVLKQAGTAIRFNLNLPLREDLSFKTPGTGSEEKENPPFKTASFPLISLPLYLAGRLPELTGGNPDSRS
jgi:predicted AAA+ superfamily ATPase